MDWRSRCRYGGANFSDIFGDVCPAISGRRRRPWRRRGSDLRYTLELDLEAVRGTTVTIRVPTLVECKTCDGSGAKKGTSPVTCTTCGVSARCACSKVSSRYSRPASLPRQRQDDFRSAAAAMGRGAEEQKTLGQGASGCRYCDRIRLSGEGEAGTRAARPAIQRGRSMCASTRSSSAMANICIAAPISFADAALGGELEVPTLMAASS